MPVRDIKTKECVKYGCEKYMGVIIGRKRVRGQKFTYYDNDLITTGEEGPNEMNTARSVGWIST